MTSLASNRLASVCFVAPYAYPVLSGDEDSQVIGGAEIQQVIIARGLAQRGYNVSMVCLNFGQEARVDIHGIRVFRAFRANAGMPIVRFLWPRITSLWSCMKQADADIYYQRTAGRYTGLVAAFCRHRGKKSIFAASGNPDFELNTTRIRDRHYRWLYEYGVKHVDRVLAQNSEQVDLCLRNYRRQAIVVPNCYEGPASSTSTVGKSILWVGTIRPLKRPDVFLDLAEALPKYRFRMIGGPEQGDKGMYSRVKARASRIENLEFTGFVPYTEIDEYFDDAALLINTSESEGFPNTFLQAWSRGTVTVSFVDCGARQNGIPVGRVVSSVEQMVRVIDELMTDKTRRHEEGMSCKEFFEKNHAPGPILDQYENIFSELVSG